MNTHVSEADFNRESSNPVEAFAPMTEGQMQEFHQALKEGFDPVPQAEEPQGKVFILDRKYSHAETTLRASIRAVSEAEFEGGQDIIIVSANGEVQADNLEREMRLVAAKQLETDPHGDGPPVVEQVIRAAYQDENPPKKALKEILLAGLKPMTVIVKEMVAKAKDRGRHARVIKVLDTAQGQCVEIDYSAPSESRGPLKILNPQIAQRHPEWAGAVLDGLETLESDFPELAFFYRIAVLTGATARDLADLFDTPLALVFDEMDQAHTILLRIIGERTRIGVLS